MRIFMGNHQTVFVAAFLKPIVLFLIFGVYVLTEDIRLDYRLAIQHTHTHTATFSSEREIAKKHRQRRRARQGFSFLYKEMLLTLGTTMTVLCNDSRAVPGLQDRKKANIPPSEKQMSSFKLLLLLDKKIA